MIKALRTQNAGLFSELAADDDKFKIRYRKAARNPLMCHIIAQMSPKLWCRITEASAVYVYIQLVRVEDQSPLVQCLSCLGYGHSSRLCR